MDPALAIKLAAVDGFDEGILLTQAGRLAEGEAALRRAVAQAGDIPDTRRALGMNLLTQGRYREGWPLYEARIEMTWQKDGLPRDLPYPRWRGEDLAGKQVVLFPEQGWGDQIQFARFLPHLAALGAHVTLLAGPPLWRLFAHSFPQIDVRQASGAVEFPDPDFWLTLLDLPGRLGIGLEDIPVAPYLATPARWPDAPPGFKTGLVAKGNANFPHDYRRSLPEDLARSLAEKLPGNVFGLLPEMSGARDFADTAAIIDQLDLVVSVDSAVGHLAGALGKRCLLLVPGMATDWRWLRNRDDSPWYPGHRLYRGAADGDWADAVRRVIADAAALA